MLIDIQFVSLEEMHQITPDKGTIVISILDKSEEPGRPVLSGFFDSLQLQFEDVAEDASTTVQCWPDNPTTEEHTQFASGQGEQVCTLRHAEAVVAFLRHHHQTSEELHLLVHCFGGISRSAAVASWAATKFWVPLVGTRFPEFPNMRLVRLMNKAAGII